MISSAFAWKLVLAVALAGAVIASARAKAPERPFPRADLRRLVVAALVLYAVGLTASLSGHAILAAVLYAAGVSISAFAAWLSRGIDADDPPRSDEPGDEPPVTGPDGAPGFDWRAFERDFRAYDRRTRRPPARTPVG